MFVSLSLPNDFCSASIVGKEDDCRWFQDNYKIISDYLSHSSLNKRLVPKWVKTPCMEWQLTMGNHSRGPSRSLVGATKISPLSPQTHISVTQCPVHTLGKSWISFSRACNALSGSGGLRNCGVVKICIYWGHGASNQVIPSETRNIRKHGMTCKENIWRIFFIAPPQQRRYQKVIIGLS